MLISNYELQEDLVVENPDMDVSKKMIFFKFQNIFQGKDIVSTRKQSVEMPSVLIATSRVNTDEFIFIHTNTGTINIEVDANYLKELFELSEKSPVLQGLLENAQPQYSRT